jgi:hypothetical protein
MQLESSWATSASARKNSRFKFGYLQPPGFKCQTSHFHPFSQWQPQFTPNPYGLICQKIDEKAWELRAPWVRYVNGIDIRIRGGVNVNAQQELCRVNYIQNHWPELPQYHNSRFIVFYSPYIFSPINYHGYHWMPLAPNPSTCSTRNSSRDHFTADAKSWCLEKAGV